MPITTTGLGLRLSGQTVRFRTVPSDLLIKRSVRTCSLKRILSLLEGESVNAEEVMKLKNHEFGEVRLDGFNTPVARRRGAKQWKVVGCGWTYGGR